MTDLEIACLSKLDKNKLKLVGDCLVWSGCTRNGYPLIRTEGKTVTINRYIWEKVHDIKLPREVLLCHTCDNRSCVNPDHLFLGSNVDNFRDSVNKGKWYASKLTKLQVKDILYRYYTDRSVTTTKISKELSMNASTIADLVKGRSYKDWFKEITNDLKVTERLVRKLC